MPHSRGPGPRFVLTQEAKYVEGCPHTTSAWAGCSRFDILVDRYGGVHPLLICTSSPLGFPTCHHRVASRIILIEQNIKKRTGPALWLLCGLNQHPLWFSSPYLGKGDAAGGENRHGGPGNVEGCPVGIEKGEGLRVHPLLQRQPGNSLRTSLMEVNPGISTIIPSVQDFTSK